LYHSNLEKSFQVLPKNEEVGDYRGSIFEVVITIDFLAKISVTVLDKKFGKI
jgi:hypothetical protein